MRRLLSLLVVLFVCPAAPAQWRPALGPFGTPQCFVSIDGPVPIAIDPLDADSVFLGGRLLWHSSDGGKTWARVENAPLRPGERIWSIAISRDEDGPILTSGTACLVSNDRGRTWQPSASPSLARGYLQAGPAGSEVFWCFNNTTIQRSDNNGLTWETVFEQPRQKGRIHLFVADRFDADTISFRITRSFEDWSHLISRDSGATGQELRLPGDDRLLDSMSTDPNDPELLYACTRQNVWSEARFSFTYDDGETWEPLFDPNAAKETQTAVWAKLRRVLPETLASHMPVAPHARVVLGRGQLGCSEDEPGRVVGVAQGIICRSRDYGKTWEQAMADLTATEIERIVLDPADPKAAFCASLERLWHTADGGATWRAMPFHVRSMNQVVFSPSGQHVFAVCWYEVWRATRTGTDWETVWNTKDHRNVTVGVFFHEESDGEEQESVAVLVTRGSLFESRDNGRTWQSAGQNALPKTPFADVLRSKQVRIAGQGTWIADHRASKWHRLASTDHGHTWAPYEPTKEIGNGQWSLAADGSMWLAAEALVHAPAPGGDGAPRNDWTKTAPNPRSVACDPDDAEVLYVGLGNGRILRTTDGGETFSRLDGGPPRVPIAYLAISPHDGALWVATEGNGVWILDNPKEQPAKEPTGKMETGTCLQRQRL
jgi:photosystem II stability/assembly factor-like uncharacterized protein